MEQILQNIILGISIAIPVGPTSLIIIQNGLKRGFWGAFLTSLGVLAADLTLLLLVFFGLSRFLSITWLKIILEICGAAVLLYLGFMSLRGSAKKIALRTKKQQQGNFLLAGFSVNLTNPLAVIWWTTVYGAMLASLVDTDKTMNIAHSLLWSLAIILGIVLWNLSLSFLTMLGQRVVNRKTFRLLSLFSGLILLGYGLWFVYQVFMELVA